MTQPNEQLIETVEKALEAVTPGPWVLVDDQLLGADRTTIGTIYDDENQILIANTPEWLRALLEENKKLWKENKNIVESWNEQKEENRSLRAGYTTANARQDEELYFWEPYAENHLETLAGGVVIRAEWMQQLIDEATQQTREELELANLELRNKTEYAEMLEKDNFHAEANLTHINSLLEQSQAELEQVKAEREGVMNYLSNAEMTASGEPAMIFMEMLVGLFEQNGGKNFLTLTIERRDKTARYSITIENLNGELSASDKLQKQDEEIESLHSEIAAKDKVLEWYAYGNEDDGLKAESILSHFRKGDGNETS